MNNGKGSSPRPVDKKAYDKNYEKIWPKKKCKNLEKRGQKRSAIILYGYEFYTADSVTLTGDSGKTEVKEYEANK